MKPNLLLEQSKVCMLYFFNEFVLYQRYKCLCHVNLNYKLGIISFFLKISNYYCHK